MDFEKIATSAVTDAISKTNRLEAFISSGDKEPSYDGSIYVYDNTKYKKDNMKKIPVQIKAKGIAFKIKPTIKYPISVIDLNNYMRNGGVIFFVVYIDKNTGETLQIYYSALPPVKIYEIMKRKTPNGKNISVEMEMFPSNADEKIEIFLNFHANAISQISFAGRDLPTVKSLQEQGVLESLTFSHISLSKNQEITQYPKIFDNKEMYLYAKIKGSNAPVPVEYYPKVSHIQMVREENVSVSVKGKVYYTKTERKITAEKIFINIGSGVTLILPNISKDEECTEEMQITIKPYGTLSERIKSLEFLIAMFKEKVFEVAGVEFSADFPEDELKNLHYENYPVYLQEYKDIQATLEKLNVKKDLDLDKLTDNEYWKLSCLVKAIIKNEPVHNIANIKEGASNLINVHIGNLDLVMICRKKNDDIYIYDYFTKHIDVCFINDKKEKYKASQFSHMTEENFLEVDNLNLQSIVDDFKSIEPQEYIANNGNAVMLSMLKAYDKRPSADLLDACKQMNEWLYTVKEFLSEDVLTINSLQIIRRERNLSYSEKQKLYDIINSTDNQSYKVGAFILLSEFDEAKKILDTIPQEEKENFMTYPIFNFYKESKEDNENE